MSALTRSEHGPFPGLLDWLESRPAVLRPRAPNLLRVEDYLKDGCYVLRAMYDNGVLEVTVSLKGTKTELQRHVPVLLNKHINPS